MPRAAQVSTVVLAAGEGTRMRSATPKVLHRIAGRALVEHAVRAAAGAGPRAPRRGDRARPARRSPSTSRRSADGTRPQGRRRGAGASSSGTGHAVALRARPRCPRTSTGTVVVTYGDVAAAGRATRWPSCSPSTPTAGNAVTVLTAVVPTRPATAASCATPTAQVAGDRRAEGRDARAARRSPRSTRASTSSTPRCCATALSRLSTDNAQGELYLTDVLGIARGDGRPVGALVCADPWLVEGVNDRVQLSLLGAELNRRIVRALDARGRHGDRPGHDLAGRRRRRWRRDVRHRARRAARGHGRRSARARRSARTPR